MSAALAVLLLALALLPAAAGANRAELSDSRPMEGQDWEALRGYGDRAARDWLKEVAGIDLNALALEWDPNRLLGSGQAPHLDGVHGPAASPAAQPADESWRGSLSLRVEQNDDLLRMTRDLRDIPFGVAVDGELELAKGAEVLKTRLWVPLSWKDEWRAQASLPVLVGSGPLSRVLTLKSDVRSRLGQSQFDAGVGTVFQPGGLGAWNVDYDFNRRFGQGAEEAIHWLRFSKIF